QDQQRALAHTEGGECELQSLWGRVDSAVDIAKFKASVLLTSTFRTGSCDNERDFSFGSRPTKLKVSICVSFRDAGSLAVSTHGTEHGAFVLAWADAACGQPTSELPCQFGGPLLAGIHHIDRAAIPCMFERKRHDLPDTDESQPEFDI